MQHLSTSLKNMASVCMSKKKFLLTAGVVVVVGLVGFLYLPDDVAHVFGAGNRNVVLDGAGDYEYSLPRVRIPEVTPSTGADITVNVVANGSGTESGYTYSVQLTKTLGYAWNRWVNGNNLFPSSDTKVQGYVKALSNINITIGYDAGVYNASTGARIPEGSSVSVGDTIVLKFGPYVPENIFWFGTGYSMDSPYGEWRTNAAPPPRVSNKVTCEQKDFVSNYRLSDYGNLDFKVYVPFVVNPPARSVVNIPENLSCDALTRGTDGSESMTCTVTKEGDMTPRFTFASTYGKFYYRYYDYRDMGSYGGPGCYGNNIPLAEYSTGSSYTSGSTMLPGYVLQIPQRVIDYPLKVGTGNAPATPILTCPARVSVDTDAPFSIVGTDSDGDTIRYGIDWVSAGSVNEWIPAEGYVSSGTEKEFTHRFNSRGTYTIKALAEDSGGRASAWTDGCVVEVTGPPACSNNRDDDGDGAVDTDDSGCSGGGDDDESDGLVSCVVDDQQVGIGGTVTYTVSTEQGARGPFTWLPIGGQTCTGGASDTNTCTLPDSGSYQMSVVATGAGRQGAQCPLVSAGCTDGSVSITATPDRIDTSSAQNTSTIEWSAPDTCTCSVSGPGLSAQTNTGKADVKITDQSIYTLNCLGTTDTAIVNVITNYEEF